MSSTGLFRSSRSSGNASSQQQLPPERSASAPIQDLNTSATGDSTNGRPPPARANSDSALHPSLTGIRHHVKFSERRFDTKTLPEDLQRVYKHLADKHGEHYGLVFVFSVRTACELHRAWHMTLLTSKILQQVKDKFNMRMTWNLGVLRCVFRAEDGGWELHRRVPYDYDSEFQDIYMKIAEALVEGHISVNEALIFQAETKLGKHTASSGLFLRDYPGRLVLYPLEAATCAVIFFGGDWLDAAVAAICGLAAGLIEYGLHWIGGDAKVLVDICVGLMTGIIGGLFQQYHKSNDYCLQAIFLGTLYWFFYGTAFVIGLLEIIAGELETGVTRFIAVSVKTFVLSLGSCIGLQIVLSRNAYDTWVDQEKYKYCNTIELSSVWWRIPLYLLCSASALGQYRVPLVNYWRGLIVQLVGYEVQFRMFEYFFGNHERDFLDTAVSNICGAMTAVMAACSLSYIIDEAGYYYSARLLQREPDLKFSPFGEFMYRLAVGYVKFTNCIGLGRKSSLQLVKMEKKLKQSTVELRDVNHPRSEIILSPVEEAVLVEAIVDAENLNIWALLMPAVYQLVPGSLIARLWYNAVFPPPLVETNKTIAGTDYNYTDVAANQAADDVFYGLFVISTSLALGLILGFAVVQMFATLFIFFFSSSTCCSRADRTVLEEKEEEERIKRMRFRQQGVINTDANDDPDGEDPVLKRQGKDKTLGLGGDRVERLRRGANQQADMSPVVEEEEQDEENNDSMLKMDERQLSRNSQLIR